SGFVRFFFFSEEGVEVDKRLAGSFHIVEQILEELHAGLGNCLIEHVNSERALLDSSTPNLWTLSLQLQCVLVIGQRKIRAGWSGRHGQTENGSDQRAFGEASSIEAGELGKPGRQVLFFIRLRVDILPEPVAQLVCQPNAITKPRKAVQTRQPFD